MTFWNSIISVATIVAPRSPVSIDDKSVAATITDDRRMSSTQEHLLAFESGYQFLYRFIASIIAVLTVSIRISHICLSS